MKAETKINKLKEELKFASEIIDCVGTCDGMFCEWCKHKKRKNCDNVAFEWESQEKIIKLLED